MWARCRENISYSEVAQINNEIFTSVNVFQEFFSKAALLKYNEENNHSDKKTASIGVSLKLPEEDSIVLLKIFVYGNQTFMLKATSQTSPGRSLSQYVLRTFFALFKI